MFCPWSLSPFKWKIQNTSNAVFQSINLKNKVLGNYRVSKKLSFTKAFGDSASSWEEILTNIMTNLEMLNWVNLSFFGHSVGKPMITAIWAIPVIFQHFLFWVTFTPIRDMILGNRGALSGPRLDRRYADTWSGVERVEQQSCGEIPCEFYCHAGS